MAAAIAGCVMPPSRSSTIWMRSRCVDGSFHRSAVRSRRTSALLHLTIRSSRIRWSQRITPQIPKTTPPPTAFSVINTPIHAVLEPVSEGRRSVEPIAAVTAPAEASVQHQRLLHFIADAPWSDEPVLAKVRKMVVPAMERHGPIEAWIVDDTSFPKCGSKSVGVHHQYCGQLGKQANCQVVVTLSVANHHASLPIAYRLYLPQDWAKDAARRKKARIPKAITFKTKPQIALEQIREACAAGVPRGVVLTDASYGSNSALRTSISALALTYVAGIVPTVKVRAASDHGELEPRLSVKELVLCLPKHAWRTITWREGTADRLRSRFARVRVRTAPIRRAAGRREETLLIEWPEGEAEPTKYWLSTLDNNISFRRLVDIAKMRWRVERDYQDLKQEIGLGHYEGR